MEEVSNNMIIRQPRKKIISAKISVIVLSVYLNEYTKPAGSDGFVDHSNTVTFTLRTQLIGASFATCLPSSSCVFPSDTKDIGLHYIVCSVL